MIRSYFKIAVRNLLKNKGFAFINIFGLAIGLTCFLLIALYVTDELGYDRFHKNADRIYRVSRTFKSNDGSVSLRLGHLAPAFYAYFRTDFPEIEQITRLWQYEGVVSLPENIQRQFSERQMFFADDNLFKVFTFNVLSGSPTKALAEPFTVMLSRPTAEKYFGSVNPIGKTLRLDTQYLFKVTGIFESLPAQSHVHPDVLFSMASLNDPRLYGVENLSKDWGGNNFATYFLLPPDYDIAKMEKAFGPFQDKHLPQSKNGRKPSEWSVLNLWKLTDIHLHSQLDSEIEPNGNIKYVYMFSAIAFFILLIACINYMNLATARSAGRAKEVGLRKVVGAQRQQLIGQFLSESVLVSLISLVVAVCLTVLLLSILNSFTDKALTFRQLIGGQFFGLAALAVLLTGVVAGSYPAFFLTSYKPINVLKGRIVTAMRNGRLRQGLVIAQFSIACVLIICTVVVYNQLSFMMNHKTGYKKDQVVLLPVSYNTSIDFESLKQEFKRQAGVKSVTHSSRIPTGRLLDSMGALVAKGDSLVSTDVVIKALSVDYDFISTYEIPMAAGRNLSRAYATDDSAAYILNESAVHVIGWKNAETAINQKFVYGGKKGTVVGVVKDFYFESLHNPIAPIVLFINRNWHNWLSINVQTSNLQPIISHLETTWKKYFPNIPFTYQFLDQRFENQYKAEQKQRTLFLIFASISIFISCLGLFALATYTAEQRTKEIGIRKVLGASVASITTLLSKDFLKLVVISIVIASPIAWYAMNRWLEDFAYKITIQWWVFVMAGILAVAIALLTVSYQSIKAALMNPVKSLRTE